MNTSAVRTGAGVPALACDGIEFAWPARGKVLEGVHLDLLYGESLALLGPNGAGKTTLLSLVSGRLHPLAGEILVDGIPLRQMGPHARARKIALLPQLEKLPFNYNVLDFVLMGRTPHMGAFSLPSHDDELAARAAMEELGVEGLADRQIGELSGGEFQLVRIARCLAQGADILVMDEPVSMLDPAHARQVADAILTLRDSGKAILYSIHDLTLPLFLGSKAMLLREGKVVWNGPSMGLAEPAMLEQCYGTPFGMASLPTAFCRSCIDPSLG